MRRQRLLLVPVPVTAYLARRIDAVSLAVLIVRVRPREGLREVRLHTKRRPMSTTQNWTAAVTGTLLSV